MRDYNHKRGDKRDTVAWNATWALYKKSHYMPPVMPRWRHNWKSAQVVNSHLVCDPTIRQQGFDLPRQQWSLLNRFRTEQGHCGACRRKWRLTDTDLCPCGETQTMSHIVESCPLTKLKGGSSRLHSADEDAVLYWPIIMVHDKHTTRRRHHHSQHSFSFTFSHKTYLLNKFLPP